MRRVKLIALTLLVLSILGVPAFAQQTPTPPALISPGPTELINPDANISWPPPVYVLRGTTQIRGSANLPNMINYFLEYRRLGPDMAEPQINQPWFPVSLPTTNSVSNDVLATWDTTTAEDAVYEVRLTVNLSGGQSILMTVRPLRIENNPPPFVQIPNLPVQPATLVPVPTFVPVPTLAPPTVPPVIDNTPRVTVAVQGGTNANVRQGDSMAYPIITTVVNGTVMSIVGLSTVNPGWFLVDLPNGGRGWIAQSVVEVSGNLNGLPRIAPPPPPVTPTPTPVPATATPTTSANLVAGLIRINAEDPTCDQTFTVNVDIANLGSQQTQATGSFVIQDIFNGQVQTQTSGPIQLIDPGKTVRSPDIPLTVSTNKEQVHTIVVTVNSDGSIPETTRDDNRSQITYELQEGDC